MPPVLIAAPLKLSLPDAGPVAVPIGNPIAQLKCFEAFEDKKKQIEAVVWECSPGVWKRQVLLAELCHFIAGHAYFTPEGGEPFEIKAGDAVFSLPTLAASGMSAKPSAKLTSRLPCREDLVMGGG